MIKRDDRTRQHAARGAEAVAVIDELRAEIAELRARDNTLIAAADADERAHRARAGLNTDGTMVHTAEEALSWLVAALFVERAANRIANEDTDELRATLANERGEGEGPSEGWEWANYPGRWGNPNGWTLIDRGLSFAAVGRNADGTGWDWHAMVPVALRGGVGANGSGRCRDGLSALTTQRPAGRLYLSPCTTSTRRWRWLIT